MHVGRCSGNESRIWYRGGEIKVDWVASMIHGEYFRIGERKR